MYFYIWLYFYMAVIEMCDVEIYCIVENVGKIPVHQWLYL